MPEPGDTLPLVVTDCRRAMREFDIPHLPERQLFASVCGDDLYGFAGPDTRIDLVGSYVAPLRQVLGMASHDEIVTTGYAREGKRTIDFRSTELRPFLRNLASGDGDSLESLFSPLLAHDGGFLSELRDLAKQSLSRQIYHHYHRLCRDLESLWLDAPPGRVRIVLRLFRSALTGLHILRTGSVESDLLRLNEEHFGFHFIDELVDLERSSKNPELKPSWQTFQQDAKRLIAELDAAAETTDLPPTFTAEEAFDDFIYRTRHET